MSVSPVWSVHCDGFGSEGCTGWTAQEETAAEAVRTARARGWYVGKPKDSAVRLTYCPACRQAREL